MMKKKRLSEKTKKKLSLGKRGAKNPMYGKHHTEETKDKMSLAQSGINHPMYGKHHSEGTKAKLRLSAKKLWTNPEYREKALANLKQYQKK